MRGGNPPRARRLVSCSGMMSFLFSLLACHWSPRLRGRGPVRSPPLLAAAPSPLSTREWMEERTAAQRCSDSDRLTDWLTLLCPVKAALWLGEAASTCWLTVATTDTYSWSSELRHWSWKHGHLVRDDVLRAMLWNEECRSANFSPPPLLYRRLLPSGVWSSRTDTFTVHHLSPVRLLRHGSSHPVTDIIDQGLLCLSLSDSLISYRANSRKMRLRQTVKTEKQVLVWHAILTLNKFNKIRISSN